MAEECDYTCSFRLDGERISAVAIDACLPVPGEHYVVQSRARSADRGRDFERWECTAESDDEYDHWSSLTDALKEIADRMRPALNVIAKEAERSHAYWWCGCFHNAATSTIHFSTTRIQDLAGFGAEVILDNYPPSVDGEDGSVDADGLSVAEWPQVLHEYRFRVADTRGLEKAVCPSPGSTTGAWLNFGEGLDACLADANEDSVEVGTAIICEHTQFGFDGGPRICARHLRGMSHAGIELTIIWRAG